LETVIPPVTSDTPSLSTIDTGFIRLQVMGAFDAEAETEKDASLEEDTEGEEDGNPIVAAKL